MVNNGQYSHLPEIQQKIIAFIMEQPKQEEGVHVAAIARAMGGNAMEIRFVSPVISH
jgi:replication factor A2